MADDEGWTYWVPGLTPPPMFLFLQRIEVGLTTGEVEAGAPERFHWYPESARGGPMVRKWRPTVSSAPHPVTK